MVIPFYLYLPFIKNQRIFTLKKTIAFLVFFALFCNADSAFCQITKKNHHIFIWDVTLSMKGYNDAPDIYDEVVDVMVNTLSNIEEDGSNIYIIPFQDVVLQTYTQKATAEGKANAINFVKDFNNENVTYTNICVAWEKAMKLIDDQNKNFLYLFTDGEQSDLSNKDVRYGKDCLNKIIDQYCALINNTENTYTFYISLNTNLPSNLKEKFKRSCPEYLRLIEGTPPTYITSIQPTNATQIVNLQEEDLSFTQYFDVAGKLPTNFSFNVLLDAQGISLPSGIQLKVKNNQNRKIENGQTVFELDLTYDDIKRLKQIMPEEMIASLIYSKPDLSSMGLSDQIIEFTPDRTKLKIRNKKEKTLKIKILQ